MLDLFAGTGAVGLEALSRGAGAAVFVESGRDAERVLRRNIDAAGLPGAVVRRRSVEAYLAATPGTPDDDGPFDLVFADPPYAYRDDDLAGVLAALGRPGRLADDAVIVVERSARGGAPPWPDPITALRERRYGEGVLWYGRRR